MRKTRVDIRVAYLAVPVRWDVGTVTFRPPGWLRNRLVQDAATFLDPDWVVEPLDDWEWATASTFINSRRGETSTQDATERISDAIGVARLYQRACLPGWGMDNQTFGLVTAIDSKLERTWMTDYQGLSGIGATRIGVGAGFTFRKGWIRNFRSRPAFAFLDDALRVANPAPGSWQQRAISAVRALNLASPMQAQPLRIVLQAVALEALLGDDPPTTGQGFRYQAHPVSQRAAFLDCEVDGLRLPPGKTACICLTGSPGEIGQHPEIAGRPPDYWDWPCTAYWHIRQVFAARNEALHDAQDRFPPRTAMRYEGRVDRIILAALDWVVATGSTGIGDLDAALARLPGRESLTSN